MSNVTLVVGGRNYTVSCADGQEEHVRRLAAVIDDKIVGMGPNLSNHEAKNLLFAGLLIADELDEARRTSEVTAVSTIDTERLGAQLERMAIALENAASTLESNRGNA